MKKILALSLLVLLSTSVFSQDTIQHSSSFGQKKRVTIASILVLNPEILILDEPTANLDEETGKLKINVNNANAIIRNYE